LGKERFTAYKLPENMQKIGKIWGKIGQKSNKIVLLFVYIHSIYTNRKTKKMGAPEKNTVPS